MNAVALADLLRSLTPAELDQLGAITREAYGPLVDQLEAATRQVHTRMLDQGAADVTVADLPEAIVLQVLDQLDQWWHGRVSTCLHAPDPRRPQSVVAAAWKPGLIVCGDCTHLLRLPRKSAADRTCDLCGRIVTGRDDDPIYPTTLQWAALLYLWGACTDCHTPAKETHVR